MEAMEAILTRRSIRDYTEEPVPEALVRELLLRRLAIRDSVFSVKNMILRLKQNV